MDLLSIFRRSPSAREKILAALASLHRGGTAEAWGLEVLAAVEKLFPAKHWWQQQMTVNTLYRNLHQLEDEGVVNARRVNAPEGNYPPRRMYRLTNPPNLV